jgi:hypothetical protein
MAPVRAIQGQGTKLSRTIHGLDYDAVHDEIVAPVYEGGAILVFRGGATGEEAPIRVIQGDKTKLIGSQTAVFDTKNDEILVGDPGSGSILAYARDANGNVAPKRVLRGPKTHLLETSGVTVDPVHDLLLVSNRGATHDDTGIVIFNRTDSGDVAPKRIIAGHDTGIGRSRQITVDPARGKIYLGVQNTNYHAMRPYLEESPRTEYSWDNRRDEGVRNRNLPAWAGETHGFVGVWDINDRGNVPPRAVIKGALSRIIDCGGIVVNPERGIVISADGGQSNMYHVYLVPQFFTDTFWQRRAGTEP